MKIDNYEDYRLVVGPNNTQLRRWIDDELDYYFWIKKDNYLYHWCPVDSRKNEYPRYGKSNPTDNGNCKRCRIKLSDFWLLVININ